MALRLFGYACNTAELSLPMYAPIFLRLSVSHPLIQPSFEWIVLKISDPLEPTLSIWP